MGKLTRSISIFQIALLLVGLPGVSFANQASPTVQIAGWIDDVTIQRVPNDPLYSSQWNLRAMNLPLAWDKTTGNTQTVIAIVDTGVNASHEDLQGSLWTNTREIPGNSVDDDNNGYVDDVNGYNFMNRNKDLSDPHGHGTGIASIIRGMGNNGRGIAGVDWQAKIMVAKALNSDGGGDFNTVAEAIRYAADNGAHIVNLSFGSNVDGFSLRSAVDYAISKGITIIAASGNTGQRQVLYPAAYSTVIAVGGINRQYQRPPFGTYGPGLDVVAPAVEIPMAGVSSTTEYVQGAGTSFATAEVTGIIALARSLYGSFSPVDALAMVQKSTDPVSGQTGYSETFGYGLINASKVLNQPAIGGNGSVAISKATGVAADGVEEAVVTFNFKDGTGSPRSGQHITVAITGQNNIVNGSLLTSGSYDLGTTSETGQLTFRLATNIAETKTITITNLTSSLLNNEKATVGFVPFTGQYRMQWLGQSPYPTLKPGASTTLSVRIKNVGNVTWLGNGSVENGQIKLGTSRPLDRISSLRAASWLSGNRAVVMNQSVVRPGQEAEFSFQVTAPSAAQTYREYFTPVSEFRSWFNDLGIYWDVTVSAVAVAAEYDAEIVDQGITTDTSGKKTAWVKLKNIGTATWQSQAPGDMAEVRLGTASPRDHSSALFTSSWISNNRATVATSPTVAPGAVGEFRFEVNNVAGTYYFQLVSEFKTWFGPLISIRL